MTSEAPDMFIWTNDKGDTEIGPAELLPWPELDQMLSAKYPDLSLRPSVPPEE